MTRLTAIILIISSISLGAQSNTAIGEWKSYFPYEAGTYVTQSDDFIYYATDEAIVTYDKEDLSIDFLTVTDGLSETDINLIKFSPFRQVLIVVYDNSNIDLVYEDEIFNLSNIVTNVNIIGSRKINDVYIHNAELAYLSTDFGIVELNLERREFGFTSFTPVPVYATHIYDDAYYAATAEGVYALAISNTVNPADFTQWELLEASSGLPSLARSDAIQEHDGDLYLASGGDVYVGDGETFTLYDELDGFSARFLSADGPDIIMGYECDDNCNGSVRLGRSDGSIVTAGGGCVSRPLFAVQESNGRMWYADLFRGFRRADSREGACFPQRINAPFRVATTDVHVENNRVYLATGGTTATFNFLFRRSGFSILQDGLWENINDLDNPLFKELGLFDILYILPDPRDPDLVYAGSYGAGLVAYRGPEDMMVFDTSNSTLDGTVSTEGAERVSGLAFDDEGNLWVSNYLAQRALSVLKTDGTWQSFELPATTLTQVDVDDQGRKWIVVRGQSQGFLVFDEGDIDDPTDDQVKLFNTSNSELTTNNVTTLSIDREGTAWIGTDQGPISFNCGDPFSENCVGFRQKVDQDGFIAFLLNTEKINTIAVDGGNRKWFGTENGVFLQSPSGEIQLEHFTTDNSPLPANQISDIAINDENGEVFIATASGLISYRSGSTGAGLVHESTVKVFPNPVDPDYTGPIAIDGLAQDALVKITDISGKIVRELLAVGGQAVWDGRDHDGTEVASGVYIVYSSTTDINRPPDGAVAKIMYVR